MLDVRRTVVRRWIALVTVTTLLAVPAAAGASPVHLAQEDPSEGEDEAATDRALIDVDETLAENDPEAVNEAIATGSENIDTQLENLQTAQSSVDTAIVALADADAKVSNTQIAIEELTEQSDAVVIEAYMNPPTENAWDVFAADTIGEATVKQALLDMRADDSADVLDQLAEQRELLEVQKAEQQERREEAAEAKSAADTALADLESAVGQHTAFILEVRERLKEGPDADLSPEEQEQVAARQAQIQGAIDTAQQQAEYQEAMERLQAELERQAEEARIAGRIICPVRGTVRFTDTWGAARSGGRSHKGTDMLASTGTPTVAPVDGRVEHRGTSLGGLSWYVYGDNGDTYYGTHLSSYEAVGVGHVTAGTVIGYVGDSGNAAGTPHLHFEWKPGGGASVNPYQKLDEACPEH